ncbi:MAG: hypothetical protein RL095_548 [Verrucomicrobiota bacterium]|jgi:uncharacterized membrane protein
MDNSSEMPRRFSICRVLGVIALILGFFWLLSHAVESAPFLINTMPYKVTLIGVLGCMLALHGRNLFHVLPEMLMELFSVRNVKQPEMAIAAAHARAATWKFAVGGFLVMGFLALHDATATRNGNWSAYLESSILYLIFAVLLGEFVFAFLQRSFEHDGEPELASLTEIIASVVMLVAVVVLVCVDNAPVGVDVLGRIFEQPDLEYRAPDPRLSHESMRPPMPPDLSPLSPDAPRLSSDALPLSR